MLDAATADLSRAAITRVRFTNTIPRFAWLKKVINLLIISCGGIRMEDGDNKIIIEEVSDKLLKTATEPEALKQPSENLEIVVPHMDSPEEHEEIKPSPLPSNEESQIELEPFDLPLPSQSKIIAALTRRINRIHKKRPKLVEGVRNRIDSITETHLTAIKKARAAPDVFAKIVPHSYELIHQMIADGFRRIETGIVDEITTGRGKGNNWEKEADEIDRKTKILSKHHDVLQAIASRQILRKINEEHREAAIEFTKKMVSMNKEGERKRKEDIRLFEVKIQERDAQSQHNLLISKSVKAEEHQQKAAEAMTRIHDRKVERRREFKEGEERVRKVRRLMPMFKRVETSFNMQQDLLYNTHGRPMEEIDRFKKERNDYHLNRNKKKLEELLYPKYNQLQYTKKSTTPLNTSSTKHRVNLSLNMKHPLQFLLKEESFHYAQLPRLKLPSQNT